PVLKKGERVKRLYLPDGEWFDFNDKKTIYLGGQQIAYRAPLNTIPIFVKKGSIVPMMPVMQYIHEDEKYPLLIHVFPNYEGESAQFELYEDDGITLDYQQNRFATSAIRCTTTETSWETEFVAKDQGYSPAKGRNLFFHYHVESKPKQVELGGKPLVELPDVGALQGRSAGWFWDAEKQVCVVKTLDERNTLHIKIQH